MKTILFKNIFREIKNTKARFVSIMLIVALGVGFFVGVKSTSPSMERMAIDYYEETNLMDFRLVSTVGFDEEDVEAISHADGVKDVMPSNFLDATVTTGNEGRIIRLLGVPKSYNGNQSISEPVVIEGRMPQKEGEIAVENGAFSSYKLNDTVTIDENVGDTVIADNLTTLEYKIVGIVKSPMYISLERGTTTVGNGQIDEFAYIYDGCFTFERYTVVYATVDKDGKEISPFTSEYDQLIDGITKNLEGVADVRAEVFTKENIDKAQKEIDDGYKELSEKKADVDKELKDAQKEIEDGESELSSQLSSAQAQIDSGQIDIQNGRKELDAQWIEYDKAVATFNDEISKAKTELEKASAEYESGYAQVEELKDTKDTLNDKKVEVAQEAVNVVISYLSKDADPSVYETLYGYAQSMTPDNCVAVLGEVKAYLSAITQGMIDPIINPSFDKVLAGIATIDENIAKLDDAIASAEEQLLPAKEKIDAGYKELNEKEQEGSEQLALFKAELEKAEKELEDASATLEDSREQMNSAKAKGEGELADAKTSLKEGREEADKEISKAEKELSDAQKKLDGVSKAQWIVFDRDDNPGYSGFTDNTNRVDAVASVFPLFFLLVAMLVCLTTMTRLVEEKRTEIGTFKALGYSDRSIAFKFIVYACLAAFFGCIIGCFSCIPTLPRVIYNAYGMLYNMEDKLTIVVDTLSLNVAIVAAFACCALVTFFVCYNNLHHKPATLMRPKAPKAGKRILLERITPLWKRLNFTSKITWRNLFRYKSRLFMTAIGIAGCTALMLAAFGLYNSINDVCDLQFGEICTYNTVIISDKEKTVDEFSSLLDDLKNDDRFENRALVSQKSVSASSGKESVTSDVYLSVVENSEDFTKMFNLKNRLSGEKLTLDNDGVILTEKLAKMLSVEVGDTVTIGQEQLEMTVSGIAENYVYNYIYCSATAYEKASGEKVLYTTVFAKAHNLDDKGEKEIGTDYLAREDVAAITFTSTIISEFKDMINSLNIVVLVMIISAGALAIVVLYNLTNINLAERNREIATIKVLGFNYKETSNFVYRENMILTFVGILFGLILGVWLWNFVVTTVEVDTVMFGKSIHALSFVLSMLLTGAFSLVVNFIMFFKIRDIDMVESLKSIE